jgi:hypothetical protein
VLAVGRKGSEVVVGACGRPSERPYASAKANPAACCAGIIQGLLRLGSVTDTIIGDCAIVCRIIATF